MLDSSALVRSNLQLLSLEVANDDEYTNGASDIGSEECNFIKRLFRVNLEKRSQILDLAAPLRSHAYFVPIVKNMRSRSHFHMFVGSSVLSTLCNRTAHDQTSSDAGYLDERSTMDKSVYTRTRKVPRTSYLFQVLSPCIPLHNTKDKDSH